jgi:hypothetical protein
MFGKSLKDDMKRVGKQQNPDLDPLRPYKHVAIQNQKNNETYVDKAEPIFCPKQYREQCNEVYMEINADKKPGSAFNKSDSTLMKHFVLTNVASRKE